MEGRRKQMDDEVKMKELMARLVESTKSSNKNDTGIDGEKLTEGDAVDEGRTQSDGKEASEARSDVETVSRITDREAKLIGRKIAFCTGFLQKCCLSELVIS